MKKLNKVKLRNLKKGQIIKVPFNQKILDAIVIDPNGLAEAQPSIGMGFQMISKHEGIPAQTLSNWVTKELGIESIPNNEDKFLKLPSDKLYRVSQILGFDGNTYSVVEVTDCVRIAADLIKHPGKIRKNTIHKVIDFLTWFAVDGFYAQAYAIAGLVYGDSTRRSLQKWKQERLIGIPLRKDYANYLVDKGEYRTIGKWTNIVYQGLFHHNARQMRNIWETQAGRKNIARNHIPESIGLEAVAYCEKLVVSLDMEEMMESHREAIALAKRKFKIK